MRNVLDGTAECVPRAAAGRGGGQEGDGGGGVKMLTSTQQMST